MTNLTRRQMINLSVNATAGIIAIPAIAKDDQLRSNSKSFTVGDIMNIIYKEIPGAPFSQTVDTLKSGNADQQVTGIVTTMFATVDIIRQSIALKSNFIIAHEPTFYNHADELDWAGNNDVAQKKLALLNENKIAVWRLHDYLHSFKPDSVRYGVVKKMGWEKYDPQSNGLINIPSTNLAQLVADFKSKLKIKHLRVIGDQKQSCSKIAVLPGAPGGQRQMSAAESLQPDVIVCGELREWETAEYIRDAEALGKKMSLILLGHAVSEEPGMEWLAGWLPGKAPGVPVKHIPTPDPFQWL
ncbi:Nif3-like dinuclear metal center hexameric protein [Pollutibacter soli]|uniref:Nif3-like dinuclear metal center hexameric protein n=1 Tax=Pollutibacter soli TaxID=3034157 RepID=UPI003013CCD9